MNISVDPVPSIFSTNHSPILKMETLSSTEMLVTLYETISRTILETQFLHLPPNEETQNSH
jgi:hypothetical protein